MDRLNDTPTAARERMALAACCEVQTGPSGQALHSSRRVESGVPVLRPQNIGLDREIVPTGLAHLPVEAAEALSKYRLRAGDILCARTGSPGRPALVTEDQQGWLYSGNLFRVRPRGPVGSAYLVQYLASPPAEAWIRMHSQQSVGIPSIRAQDFSQLPVPIPTAEHQRRVGDALAAVDEQISAHLEVARAGRELRAALAARLFSAGSPPHPTD